jgi:hypothetical protein
MSTQENVSIKFNADHAAAQTAIESIAKSLEGMAQRGERSAGVLDTSLGKLTTTIVGVSSAQALASVAFNKFIDDQDRLRRKVDETTRAIDEQMRRFAAQAGTFSESHKQRIFASAERSAVGFDVAADAARQMISSGFAVDEVVNKGGLDAFLASLSATNATGRGGDATSLAKAMGQYLAATGQDKTAANVAQAGVNLRGLFMGTNLQMADLTPFAAEAGAVTKLGRIAPQDQLAMYSTLLDTLDPSRAAVQMRNTITSLATAGGEDAKIEALNRIGLTPTDVDFVGEGYDTVFGRLKVRLADRPQEEQNVVLAKLFGRENLTGATTLIDRAGEVARRRAMMGDVAGFERAVRMAGGGPAAEMRRLETIETRALEGRADMAGWDAAAKALDVQQIEEGWSWPRRASSEVGWSIMSRIPGVSPSTARWMAGGSGAGAEAIDRRMRGGTPVPSAQLVGGGDLAETNQVLHEILTTLKQPRDMQLHDQGDPSQRRTLAAERAGQ